MWKWLSGSLIALGLLIQPAVAQYAVVAACPNVAAIYATGQTNRIATVDIYGNVCTAGAGGGSVTQGTSPWVVSNGGTFPVQAAQSGTWTMQPGNTANTTPWLTASNPSSAAGAAVTPAVTGALATSQVIKASAGNLYSLNVSADSTLSGAAWWVMVHNSAAAPAAGAVTPLKCYALASGTTMLALAFNTPVRFGTGISVTVSTTGCFTQTDSAHAFISGDAS